MDRRKVGFNASINSLFDFAKKENRELLLDDSEVSEIIDRNRIEQLLRQEGPLPNSQSKFLFNFLNIKLFLEING
jgi:asparagine synthase (glutamine-hydrolysing)